MSGRRPRRKLHMQAGRPRRRYFRGRKSFGFKTFILGFVFFAFLVIGFFATRGEFWDGETRLVLVAGGESVVVYVFDPARETIYSIPIPSDTEVNLSNGLGLWRIGSVWELGKIEGLGGDLLASTITKSLRFPVDYWSDSEGVKIADGGIRGIIAALSGFETDLNFKSRIALAIFSLKTSAANRQTIDPLDTGYLYKASISGGDKGYLVRKRVPSRLASLFAVDMFLVEDLKIRLVDGTGNYSSSKEIVDVVDMMGGKVLGITEKEFEGDCIVQGAINTVTAVSLARVFDCEFREQVLLGNFDIELLVGEAFGKRF